MPVLAREGARTYDVHGSRFVSYAGPGVGTSEQLCSWPLEVPARPAGTPQRPTRAEALLGLTGALTVTLEGQESNVIPGDVVAVAAGVELRVDGGPAGAPAWVTTTPGLEAVMPDGSSIIPPWAS